MNVVSVPSSVPLKKSAILKRVQCLDELRQRSALAFRIDLEKEVVVILIPRDERINRDERVERNAGGESRRNATEESFRSRLETLQGRGENVRLALLEVETREMKRRASQRIMQPAIEVSGIARVVVDHSGDDSEDQRMIVEVFGEIELQSRVIPAHAERGDDSALK